MSALVRTSDASGRHSAPHDCWEQCTAIRVTGKTLISLKYVRGVFAMYAPENRAHGARNAGSRQLPVPPGHCLSGTDERPKCVRDPRSGRCNFESMQLLSGEPVPLSVRGLRACSGRTDPCPSSTTLHGHNVRCHHRPNRLCLLPDCARTGLGEAESDLENRIGLPVNLFRPVLDPDETSRRKRPAGRRTRLQAGVKKERKGDGICPGSGPVSQPALAPRRPGSSQSLNRIIESFPLTSRLQAAHRPSIPANASSPPVRYRHPASDVGNRIASLSKVTEARKSGFQPSTGATT